MTRDPVAEVDAMIRKTVPAGSAPRPRSQAHSETGPVSSRGRHALCHRGLGSFRFRDTNLVPTPAAGLNRLESGPAHS